MKLSDGIIIDARVASEFQERSIAGQIEHWAQLGRAIEPLLNLVEVIALKKSAKERSLEDALNAVDTSQGRERLVNHLNSLSFPHYAPSPEHSGFLIRTEEDGQVTLGRFRKRQFVAKKI